MRMNVYERSLGNKETKIRFNATTIGLKNEHALLSHTPVEQSSVIVALG
jgi:hypothetical protein